MGNCFKNATEPLVTVIIATRNRCSLLSRALKSVSTQTYRNLEVIVVDDASEDDTSRAVDEFRHCFKNLEWIHNDEPRGGAAARNRGIRNASGEYIAFLDDDDEWLPDKMEKQITIMERDSSIGLTSCWNLRYFSDGIIEKIKRPESVNFSDLLWDNHLGSCSFCAARAGLVKEVGGFDESLVSGQDCDLWLKLARVTKIHVIPEYLAAYYEHGGERISNKMTSIMRGYRALYLKYSSFMTRGCRRYHVAFLYYLKFRYLSGGRMTNLSKMFLFCPREKLFYFSLLITKNLLPGFIIRRLAAHSWLSGLKERIFSPLTS